MPREAITGTRTGDNEVGKGEQWHANNSAMARCMRGYSSARQKMVCHSAAQRNARSGNKSVIHLLRQRVRAVPISDAGRKERKENAKYHVHRRYSMCAKNMCALQRRGCKALKATPRPVRYRQTRPPSKQQMPRARRIRGHQCHASAPTRGGVALTDESKYGDLHPRYVM